MKLRLMLAATALAFASKAIPASPDTVFLQHRINQGQQQGRLRSLTVRTHAEWHNKIKEYLGE